MLLFVSIQPSQIARRKKIEEALSFQGKNFQSRSSDNNNTTAKCKHYSSYQYFTIINGEREINEAIKLISCVGSQDLEALKKKKKDLSS